MTPATNGNDDDAAGETDDHDADEQTDDSGSQRRAKTVSLQIKSETASGTTTRHITAELSSEQYQALQDLKREYGFTWKGLLMMACRELDGTPDSDADIYDAIYTTRKRHGLTWKGMFLFALRRFQSHENGH